MARERRGEPTPAQGRGGIADELAAADFLHAVEVGRGGAGVVYRCYQTSLARNVAVKVMASDLDGDSRERFLREGYAMGRLSGHPNIVNILQVGVTESHRPLIVMPYYAASSLQDRLRQVGPIAWPEALKMGVKLCGALETAHRAGTLHRDIKPANVLLNDYGEPQLSDFGIARVAGGFETRTGFFTGTIAFTAPEVLSGNPPTVVSDVYSLGATLYALIAGAAAHERRSGEELVAHYLRIGSTPVPDMRPGGIPADLCAVIEKAMSIDPAGRQASAAELGHDLQAAQRRNGLVPDTMAISEAAGEQEHTVAAEAVRLPLPGNHSGGRSGPVSAPDAPTPHAMNLAHMPWSGQQHSGPPAPPKRDNRKTLLIIGAAAAAVLLVLGGILVLTSRDGGDEPATASASRPTTAETQAGWAPITNARVARQAAATTEADGTIWIFGGVGADGQVSGRHEGYDPAIDNWKGGDDLPVPVQHAMSVTWQGNPVVLGGWRAEGSNTKVATDQVWRVINGRWVALPPLAQPRAAGAAAVVGDRLVVTGGVDADGRMLETTEVFDGTAWSLGEDLPTPRQLLGAASDGKRIYTVGGNDGNADLATVEAYDPAADSWATLPAMPQPRSDLGVAMADARLVAAGGVSGGQTLKTVAVLDIATSSWSELPEMSTPRHGMALAAVDRSVYVIGGTRGDDTQVTSTAETLKLLPRTLQPASAWRSLPDAPSARLMMAWTVLDDKIWIAGGMTHGETLQTVQSFDPQTGSWQPQPPLPIPLHHATAATYRGEVVVIGGSTDELAQGSDKVYALRGNSWVELPSLNHARTAAAATVVGDKLIVVGGQNEKQLVPQTEIFDGQSWTVAADLPTPREHLAAVSDGQYLYTVGGRFLSADKNSAAFERFDPASGEWTTLVEMPTPRGSYGAAFIDGRIVAIGGEEPTRVLTAAEMYDIAPGKWMALPQIPTARHGEVVAVVGNTVYAIGGADRPTHEGAVGAVEALDFN
ncbi:Kelch repeat-containing protein [Mycobacterium sp. C31M]